MTIFAGMRATDNAGTDERPKNFRELILWRDPNGSAPLTALMSKMKKENTDDPEFNWWEEEQNAVRVKVSATTATTDAGTTINVDTSASGSSALALVAGDILMVEKAAVTTYSYDLVQVAANPSVATSFTVTRSAAGSTAAAIATATWLLKIGSAFAEGSTSPSSSQRNSTKFNNYTQIFKTSYR
jgi:hypothetical protein